MNKSLKSHQRRKISLKKTLLLDCIYWIYSSAWLERIPDKVEDWIQSSIEKMFNEVMFPEEE